MKFLIFIFIIFFISFVFSATLSMSPEQINFNGFAGEKICKNVTIKTNGSETLFGEDFWAEDNYFERDLRFHNRNASELKLNLDYPLEISLENRKIISVCITGEKSGDYHGILLYKIRDKPLRIGIWINASINEWPNSKITGETIKEEIRKDISLKNLFISFTILLLIFFILFVKKRK